MNRIRLLAEQVANQIAAGEVIERPASVIKELVENALDADAQRITVEIQAGGRSLMRVIDDGIGMSRDDALLCFERHATSKIQRAEDLAAVTTMGFRGEALPSIASVSQLTLTTRERDSPSPSATQVVIHGGKTVTVREASGPPGTSVEVRQLFFNLPPRRKFMRSEETEKTHIQHYLTLAALAYPEVGFTFSQHQRLTWQLPPLPLGQGPAERLAALRERLRALYGGELAWVPVDHTGQLAPPRPTREDFEDTAAEEARPLPLRIWGFIGAPGVSRATREDQHVFVNRRPVDNRGLNWALLEGYHTALMKGRYPVCCLFLEVEPAQVDVNIHPAKREVKFHAENQVRAVVVHAVRAALSHAPTAQPPLVPPTMPVLGVDTLARASVPATDAQGSTVSVARPDPWPLPAPVPPPVRPAPPPAPSPPPAAAPPPRPAPAAAPLLEVPLRLVGVIGRLYVVLESDRGLVLLDQHAAHERVLFEQMLRRLDQGAAPSQRLLLPETIELPPRDAHFLREQLSTLARLGVGLSEFGERAFLLDSLPPFVTAGDARRFVLELIDELQAAGQEVSALRLGEQTVAKTVCRHAVKAHDPLTDHELRTLLEDLRHCAMPYTCPHGRPTLIELNYRELEKKFGRVQ